jgi:down-regulator of transcription 1
MSDREYGGGSDDLSLPKGKAPPSRSSHALRLEATVGKIITEILGNDSSLAFAKDARDLLIECCVEFVTLLSSEANDIAEREAKKTIACEHVVSALKQLGYPDYIGDISKVAQEHKTQQAVRRPFPVDSELTSASLARRSTRNWNSAD